MDFENKNVFTDKTFADFIKSKREANELSVRSLAKLIKISAVYLSDIENYNRPAPRKPEVLEALALHLGLNNDEKQYMTRAAMASRDEDLEVYLKGQPRVCLALRMAQELPDDLVSDEWENFIQRMIKINSEQDSSN